MKYRILFKIFTKLLLILAIFIFLTEKAFAEDNSIHIGSKTSKDGFKIIISALKGISTYKSFILSDETPSKIVVDISGQWKNQGESILTAKNNIVSKIRVGEHPDHFRVVLELKAKEKPVFDVEKKSEGIVLTLKDTKTEHSVQKETPFLNVEKKSEGIIMPLKNTRTENSDQKQKPIISTLNIKEKADESSQKSTEKTDEKSNLTNLYDSKKEQNAAIPEKEDNLTKKLKEYFDEATNLFQQKQYDKAMAKFEYLRDHATTQSLKSKAVMWMDAIEQKRKASKPFRFTANLSYQYNNNIPQLTSYTTITTKLNTIPMSFTDPYTKNQITDLYIYYPSSLTFRPIQFNQTVQETTQEIKQTYEKKSDFVAIGYFSGSYNFINEDDKQIGLGYTHFQTQHYSLSQYNMIGSIFDVHLNYQFHPLFRLGFAYLPSYYWVDSASYLRSHIFKTELTSKFNERFITNLSYKYYDNSYFNDSNRNGHSNDILMSLSYKLGNKGYIFGGIGYDNNAASDAINTISDAIQSYSGLKAKLGFSYRLPWEFNLGVSGEYYDRKYDQGSDTDKRKDSEYHASVSLSHKLFYDWLRTVTEFNYIKNRSNIEAYEYDRQTITQSIVAEY